MDLKLSVHPEIIFAYQQNHVDLKVEVYNTDREFGWYEADVIVGDKLSIFPTGNKRNGRIRFGTINKGEKKRKLVKLYSNKYTPPKIYNCKVVVYSYDEGGVIDERIEKSMVVRSEVQKPAVI